MKSFFKIVCLGVCELLKHDREFLKSVICGALAFVIVAAGLFIAISGVSLIHDFWGLAFHE